MVTVCGLGVVWVLWGESFCRAEVLATGSVMVAISNCTGSDGVNSHVERCPGGSPVGAFFVFEGDNC